MNHSLYSIFMLSMYFLKTCFYDLGGFFKATIYFLPIYVPLFVVIIFFYFRKNLQLRETGWTPIYDNEITQQFCFENGASFWNCGILDAMTRDTEKEKFNVLFARKKYKKLQSWWKSISCIFIIRAHKAVLLCVVLCLYISV